MSGEQQLLRTVAVSAESSRRTYVLRRAGVLVVAFVAGLGLLLGTGEVSMALIGAEVTGSGSPTDADVAPGLDSEPTGLPVETTPGELASASEEVPVETTPGEPASASEEVPVEIPQGEPALPSADRQVSPEVNPRASRLVAQSPERVLDTRRLAEAGPDDPPLAAPEPGLEHALAVPSGRTAVGLSISLVGSETSGQVVVDGGAGVVEAITVGSAGATTTNFVVVPVLGDRLTVRSTAGGHLVIDVVASFEPSQQSASGRLITVPPTEVVDLVTASDGRDTAVDFGSAVPLDQTGALIVVVTADVGTDGGMVRLGPEEGAFNQMLMWAPATGDDRLRSGIVVIEPSELGAYLRYEGGDRLTVQVIGYFTNEQAEISAEGLFVPSGPRLVYAGLLTPDDPVEVAGLDPSARSALVVVGSSHASSGRIGTFLLKAESGSFTYASRTKLEGELTVLGVFL